MMGSGSSRKVVAYEDITNKKITSRPTESKEAKSAVNNNDRFTRLRNARMDSELMLEKCPSNIDEIMTKNNSIRRRFKNDSCMKKVLPRLKDLVNKAKKSCLKTSTIQSEYCDQLREIFELVTFESDEDGNILTEQKDRSAVVISTLSEIAEKLGIIWTLSKALKVLRKHQSPDLEDTESKARKLATDFCKLSANICNTYKKSGIIDMVVDDLQNPVITKNYIGSKNNFNKNVVVTSIIVIDVCAMHGTIDQELRSTIITIVYPWVRCQEKTIQLHAVLCLCQLQSENSKDLFLEDKFLVTTLFESIRQALGSPGHCCSDVNLLYLLHGLTQLTSRDTNHAMLVSNGIIDLLKHVLRKSDQKEKEVAVKAVWFLSFDSAVKEIMRKDSEMLSILGEEATCNMPAVRNAADAVMKHVDEGVSKSEDDKSSEEENSNKNEEKDIGGKVTGKGHVMISYQWDTQEVLLRVRDKLKEAGYVLWMDVDNIEGSTLQSMAEAVENAAVVLVCFSHRYKSSPNARTEAEYAFQLRKDIIPLKMEEGYQADGWLGAIIGTKLYIEIDPEGDDIDSSMQKLTKELGKRGLECVDNQTHVVVPQTEVDTGSAKTVSNWNHNDVIRWAHENGIKSRKVSNMTGDDLVFLKNLKKEAPEYFYNTLENKLGITSLNQIRMFTTALKNL